MNMLSLIGNVSRSKGDPKIIESGPSSLDYGDRLAKGLGWFSLALGMTQLLAPRVVARTVGMEGSESLLRAYGVREIVSGVVTLSPDKSVGLWSRVAGDVMDVATLMTALDPYNYKRDNTKVAVVAVLGITVLDIIGALAVSERGKRAQKSSHVDYSNRTGFPKGIESARGAAAGVAGQFGAAREKRAGAMM